MMNLSSLNTRARGAAAHFVERARERGMVHADPERVFAGLVEALRVEDPKVVNLITKLDTGVRLFRFEVPVDGPFVARVDETGVPITVITTEMARDFKKGGSRHRMRSCRSPSHFHLRTRSSKEARA